MASCIDIKAIERFVADNGIDAAPDLVKHLVFKWQSENNTDTEWPSAEYITEQLRGERFDPSEAQLKLFNTLKLNETKSFPTREALRDYINNNLKSNGIYCFPQSSIYTYRGATGDYKLSLGLPTNAREKALIKQRAKEDGTFMKAPNGKPTNLTENQWLEVRTKSFKDWFGDWENDPENSSKVVDENGEPLVVYHYTTEHFNTFDISFFGQSDQGDVGRGFYFTTYSPEDTDFFLKSYGNVVMPVFLNIKKPVPFKEVNELDVNGRKIGKVSILDTRDFNREFPNKPLRDVLQRKLNSAKYELEDIDYKLSGKDEFFINDGFHNQILNDRKQYLIQKVSDLEKQLRETSKEDLDKSIYADRNTLDEYDGVFNTNFEIVVKNPNQIKSATDNIGTYSNINERIDLQENKSDKDTQIDITELPDKIGPEELYSKLEALYDPNSSEGKLAKLIFDSLKSLPITFEKTDSLQGSFGQWVASAKTIMLNKNGIARNTLLHESIHALTSYYLNHPRRSELPQHIQIALKEIEHCYKLLVNDYLNNQLKLRIKTWKGMEEQIGGWIIGNDTYGYTSPSEMIAELSNPEFVKNIRRADNNYKGRNIFKRLVDAIFSLFKTNKEYTSIEKTLKEALVKLITNPSVELYEKYSQENANIKNNIKKLKSEASIKFRYTEDQLRNLILSKLEDVNSSIDNPYSDIILELEGNGGYGNTVANDFEVTPRVQGFLTNARPGTILISPAGVFTLLNGKVETSVEENKVTIPLRVLSEHFLAYNTFDIVKDERGIAYMTNIRPLEYKLPKKEQAKKETSLPQLRESTNNTTPNFYEGSITPDANTVFVFGSNPEGRHGAGAAKVAKDQFGAVYGQGEGLQGNSYAIPTKDLNKAKGTRWYKPGEKEEQEVKAWYNPPKAIEKGTVPKGYTEAKTEGVPALKFSKGISKRHGTRYYFLKDGKYYEKYEELDYSDDSYGWTVKELTKGEVPVRVQYYFEGEDARSHSFRIMDAMSRMFGSWSSEDSNGHSYADVYKHPLNKERSVKPQEILESIEKMYQVARENPQKTFKVADYPLGKLSLNGYLGEEMMQLFKDAGPIPANVMFSKNWIEHWNDGETTTKKVNTQIKDIPETKPLSTLVNHSGGAHGSDTYWGQIGGKWSKSEVPTLTENFAGIGTREINDAGKRAIEEVYKKTAEQGVQKQVAQKERNTFEPENSRNDTERFADKVESENTISSDRTILTNEELKYWNEQGVGEKPRILVASERTDPAFHVKEILEVLNGDKTVAEWGVVNGKRQKVGDITGKDFAGLYLITKHDGLPMLELLETKIPKLIHFSITTLGGTEFEPGVMKYNDLLDRIQEYLKKGLDPNSVTIRIDPIVPGVTNFDDIETVVRRASEMGINRIRFSVMDAYPNTVAAMKDKYDFGKYYNGFNAKPEYINAIADFMLEMKKKYNVRMGTCAEALVRPGIEKDGCLSVAAINEMLGTSIEDKGTGNNTQRKLCSCYGGKIDALAYDSKCASHCIYCYAKHENDKALEYYDEQGRLKDTVYTRTSRETNVAEPAAPETTVVNSPFPTIEETKEEIAREDPLWENAAWKNVMKDPEFQYASMLADQGRVLTEQWGIPMSRIEEAAIEIGNYISDLITEVQRNPARAKALLGIELTQAEVEKMTRPELITRISPNRLMAQVKKTKFDTSKFNESQRENEDLVEETDAIFNNWEFVMSRAATIILENEKVQFKYNPKTKTTTAVEKNNEFTNPDDIEGQRLEDGVEETHENQQEWGIESKTLDLLNDVASPLVKDAFRQCYLTDAQGKIVQSERGINKRVRTRDAINQVFAWTVGVQSMNDAIQRLKAKSVKAQWLLPIVARLEDTSGKESDFQNQFWTVIRNSNVVYSVVKRTKQGMKAMDVSSNQVRREQVSSIKSLIQMGEHPLFGANGINANNLGQYGIHLSALKDVKESLSKDIKEGKDIKNNPNYKKAVGSVGMLANLLGYYAPEALITENLNNESFNDVYTYLTRIGVNLDRAKGNNKYDAFSYEEGSHGIGSYLNNLVGLLSASLQDTHITSIFDNGKMYQTRVKPSALLTQLAKFQLEDKEFKKFISDTYNLPWFRDTSEPDITKGWRLTFMQNLINNPEVRQNLQHQIQLNYNKKQYMKNMNPIEYTLATIAQFLAENPLGGKSTANKYAWFRIPIQSNKPTSEYLKMKCETDAFFRDTITDRMAEIFDQELSRIQTVTLMNAQKGDDKYIKNFSKRGKEFCFLDFMNMYLEGGSRANTELGKLIRAKIRGEEVKEGELLKLKKAAIKAHMQNKVDQMLANWEQTGIAEAVKDFANIGKDVRHALEVFAWNDALASMNIMELFVHDIAFYDGADDLQKRLAELHAPGIRPNLDARDYQGKPVSDGIHRSIMLADAEGLTSNIIDNVSVVFDRRIQNAPEGQKGIWEDLKENLVGEKGLFRDINATDGQAYNSPSSFRKKAIMFGKWDISKERLYQKIRSGKYTPEDVRKAFSDPTFGVLKPTTFGHSRMDTGVAPLNQISVPTYNKNSEYTLFMAEALLAGENTGRPNLLRAIFDVMEESHVGPNGEWKTNGIDTIQFVSAVKSGVGKTVDIASLMEDADGEAKAKLVLTQAIYNIDKADLAYDTNGKITVNPSRTTNGTNSNLTKLSYNKDIVRELPYDAFALQMDVANHFKEHEQIFGSQDRMIIPSELPEFNARGEEIMYNTPDGPKNAKEFRKAYEDKIAAQIADSVAQVEEELGLTNNSPIERKAAISKLLQREIMSNPRYGMDLYLAVSINPATRDFTIPLGDPVNSKRIESLLNAIIKDRINKQMISGGPIVQVTSFGTSRRLGIKFKGRNGEILKTREEFNGTEEMYKRYLQDNQAGIAYMEVYASPYTNKLFEEFADANGVIDIKAIEAVNPELLKMIGYRIPTEAKYSISPLKIVGFLPRECGEGIMLPYDITLLNGSDFDVDKMYVMTKRLEVTKRQVTDRDVKSAMKALENISTINLSEEGDIQTTATLEDIKKTAKIGLNLAESYPNSVLFGNNKNSLVNRLANAINLRKLITPEEEYALYQKYNSDMEFDLRRFKVRKGYASAEPSTYGEDIELDAETRATAEPIIAKERQRLEEIRDIKIDEARDAYRASKVKERILQFLKEDRFMPSEYDDAITSALRKAYLDFIYKVETPKDVKYQRDNDIIDMQWEVLTKEEVAHELLNPGGFDPQKRMGYIINAYKNRVINEETKQPYTYEELCAIKNLKKLASLSAGSSNLMFFDTQVQYYKQNSAAGSLTGIFAVHRTAHAILEGDGLFVDVDKVGKLESQVNSYEGRLVTLNPVTVLGMPFKGRMPIDVRFSRNGEYVGKQLGNSVAAAVDAGKYPVLNLFNVNGITANVYTTLIKMGMPFEDVALFLGQKVISDLLDAHARASVTGYTSIYSLMEEMLNALDKKHKFKTSKVEEEDLTREELIKGLLERDDKSDYKTIRALRAFFGIANACRLPVAATRLNSVTSAVGPLVTDNIIDAIKRENLNADSNIYDSEVGENPITFEDIVDKHPILREFNKTYGIADKVFADMPTNSSTFRSIVNTIGASPLGRTFFNDSKLMSALSDFFQTYLAYANGVVKEEETLAFINDFPKAFAHRKYKERFKGNAFIEALQFETKEGSNKVALNVDTTGWDQSLKSPLSSAWLDLYNTNSEGRRLAVALVKYFIHKGGVGFTPKTAMNLVPTLLKEKVPNYNEAFKIKNIPSINTWQLVDMFIRNNWDNYKLVPLRKLGDKDGEIKGSFTSEGVSITDLADVQKMQNTLYFRTKKGKEDILLRQKEVVKDELDNPVAITYERVAPLGANGSYVEISTTKASKEATTTMVEQETSETPYGVNEDTSMEAADDVISNRASTANYLITFGEIDRLTTLLLSNNRDLAKAVKRKADIVETNSEDKALNAQLEEHFNTELERIGIQNEERVKLVQDIINKINPC